MKYFRNLYFRNSLKQLELYFLKNNLGENIENIKYLGDGIKKLPNSLVNLTLFL